MSATRRRSAGSGSSSGRTRPARSRKIATDGMCRSASPSSGGRDRGAGPGAARAATPAPPRARAVRGWWPARSAPGSRRAARRPCRGRRRAGARSCRPPAAPARCAAPRCRRTARRLCTTCRASAAASACGTRPASVTGASSSTVGRVRAAPPRAPRGSCRPRPGRRASPAGRPPATGAARRPGPPARSAGWPGVDGAAGLAGGGGAGPDGAARRCRVPARPARGTGRGRPPRPAGAGTRGRSRSASAARPVAASARISCSTAGSRSGSAASAAAAMPERPSGAARRGDRAADQGVGDVAVQLLQPDGRGGDRRDLGEVGEHRSAPQRVGLRSSAAAAAGSCRRGRARGEQRAGLRHVQVGSVERQPVAAVQGLQPCRRRAEVPAQPGHVAVQGLAPDSGTSAGHSASTRWSTETARPSARASSASTARRLGPRTSTAVPSTTSRSGPRTSTRSGGALHAATSHPRQAATAWTRRHRRRQAAELSARCQRVRGPCQPARRPFLREPAPGRLRTDREISWHWTRTR